MEKVCLLKLAVISLVLALGGAVLAQVGAFEYPCYLLDANDPDGDGWTGINAYGYYPVPVIPEQWLVGPPPSELSAVTLPLGHSVELDFCSELIDDPGDDIFLREIGRRGEQARVFITDGAGQEYFLGIATASSAGGPLPTEIGFDISGISLPFVPCAVRVIGMDGGGDMPGFDLNSVWVRTYFSYCQRADLNDDGTVNFEDFAILALYWIDDFCWGQEWCGGSDFDDSHKIDFRDLKVLVQNWLCRITTNSSDLNRDGIVNFQDFAVLAYYWRDYNRCWGPKSCGGSDFDNTGTVDLTDLRTFAQNWLWQAEWYSSPPAMP